jgi:hypothetical protein
MNKGLRLKFTPETYAILSDYKDRMVAELREANWSKAINEIVIEYDHLVRHFHATPAPLSRHSSYARETVDLNIKEKKYTKKEPQTEAPKKKRKKTATSLPKDFAPPKSVSDAHGLDHEGAVEAFKDQAISKDYVYVDWNAAYRVACRGYLSRNNPHLVVRAVSRPQDSTEVLRNEDMNDTRPPLV